MHSCPDCNLWSYNGKNLVNGATHKARIAAHKAIDPLWETKRFTRSEVYRAMAVMLSKNPLDCHIGLFDEETARRLLTVIPNIIARCEARKQGTL